MFSSIQNWFLDIKNTEPVNFVTVINNPEYKKMKYETIYSDPNNANGKLFYGHTEIKVKYIDTEEYKNLDYRSQSTFSDFVHSLGYYDSIVKGLDAHKIKLENSYEEIVSEKYKAYALVYGIPADSLLVKKNPFTLATHSLQAIVDSKTKYKQSTGKDARFGITRALQDQEDIFMYKIPSEVKSDPRTLRNYIEEQLMNKGTSYEKAINQFKNLEDQPIEGSYVLCKLIAQCDAWEALRSKKGSEGLPFDAVWRYCIDENYEKNGAYYFENEPFYILAMLRGLARTLQEKPLSLQDKRPLTREDYENFAARVLLDPPIHKSDFAIQQKDVKERIESTERERFEAKMVDKGQHFETKPWINDEIGKKDLAKRTQSEKEALERMKSANTSFKDYWLANATGFEFFDYGCIWHKCGTTHSIISNRIFYGLHQMVNAAKTPGERLIAYIWTARELEVCHLMEDGNGRTAIYALINWIAEDEDLPLYLPEDPNILDLQGPEKLMRDIHSGMVRAAELSGKQKSDIASVDTLLDQAGIRGKDWDVVHKRAELPEEIIEFLVDEDKKSI